MPYEIQADIKKKVTLDNNRSIFNSLHFTYTFYNLKMKVKFVIFSAAYNV